MALTKIKLNTMVTGTLPDANIPNDITIDTAAAVPASGLTGNTLASGVTASSLTSVGTLTGLTVAHNNITLQGTGETQLLINAASGNNPGIRFQENSANKWTIANDQSDDSLFFYDFGGSSKRFSIDSAGDVSLLTAGKRYYIPRASDGALTGSLYSSTGNTITLSGAGSSSGQINFIPSASNSSAVAMTINSSQNVGIGDTSPSYKLEVKGNIGIQRSTNTEVSEITMEAGQFDIKASPYGYAHRFFNGTSGTSTEKMRITTDGNVEIKNTTAASTNSQSLPGYLSFQGNGWDSDSGSDPIEGRITFAGSYGGTSAGAESGGGVIPRLEFGIINSGDAGSTSESLTTVMSIQGAKHNLTGGNVSIAGGQSTYSSLGIHTGGTNTYSATGGTHHQNSAITIDFPNSDQSYGAIRWRSHGSMEQFFGVVQQGSNGQGDWVWQGYDGSAYNERLRLTDFGDIVRFHTDYTNRIYSGYTTGNAGFSVTFPIQDSSSLLITAIFTHYGAGIASYGCARMAWLSCRDNSQDPQSISNITSSNGGSWSISTSGSVVTVSKVAGSYSGGGHYWVKIEGSANL